MGHSKFVFPFYYSFLLYENLRILSDFYFYSRNIELEFAVRCTSIMPRLIQEKEIKENLVAHLVQETQSQRKPQIPIASQK